MPEWAAGWVSRSASSRTTTADRPRGNQDRGPSDSFGHETFGHEDVGHENVRALKRLIPAAVTTAAVLFATASPAFAHVEISSPAAVAGQPATMTVTVPNERR